MISGNGTAANPLLLRLEACARMRLDHEVSDKPTKSRIECCIVELVLGRYKWKGAKAKVLA